MIRIDHREGISGNFAPLNLSTTSGYVLTFDANGLPVIGPAATGGSVATDILFDAKGDLAVGTGSDTAARLAAGTNNFVLTADSATATGLKWAAAAGGVAVGDSPTWIGKHIFSAASAANAPTLTLTGTIFSGGDGTTTKPHLLIEPSGASSTSWSSSGTLLGVNASSGFAGSLIDAQVNGLPKFTLDVAGTALFAGSLTCINHLTFGNTGYLQTASRSNMSSPANGVWLMQNAATTDFSRLQLGGTTNAFPSIKRNGTGIDFRLADDSAYSAITAGNILAQGGSWIQGGIIYVGTTGQVAMKGPADGVLTLLNSAETNFNRLQLGGTTASFPAIKRSGAALEARLADDSASTDLTVATEAYGAGWNDDMTVPTKDAVYEKINTMAGGSEAKGYLTSNQPTTSSTAVNATGLSFAIAASEVWSFEFNLVLAVSAAGASHKFAIDVPTGCTVGAQVRGSSGTTVISADATLGAGVMSTSTGGVIIAGTVQNGVNAGTVQLMFASGDGTNTATITGSGSFFMARKMN